MNNDNNENLKRFWALKQGNQSTQSEISSSVPVLTPHEEHQRLQRHQSQTVQKQQPQLQSVQRQHQLQPIQRIQPQLQYEQKQQHKQKKKKCRGDRKRQRFVAKLYKQRLSKEEIDKLINDYNNANQDQNDEESTVPDLDVELLIPVRDQVESPIYQ
jgi:hypothetical protein